MGEIFLRVCGSSCEGPKDRERGEDIEVGLEDGELFVEASEESPDRLDPCEESLYDPSSFIGTEFTPILGFGFASVSLVGGYELKALRGQLFVMRVAVISPIPDKFFDMVPHRRVCECRL